MNNFNLTQKGFSILEVILAAAIFVFLGSSAVIVVIQGLNTNRLGAEYSVATQFASEGIEGVRSIKNRDFASLVDTPGCGIIRDKVTGQDVWTFQATCTDNRLTHNSADEYIRTIKVDPVYRSGVPPAGDIVESGGTIDLNSKKITSTVTWNFTSNRPESISLVAYLSDWKKEISNPPTVITVTQTNVTAVSARLNGTADPNGGVTTGWFRYDTVNPGTCNDTFGIRAPASGGDPLGSGTTAVPYDEDISGLSASTTYYYCAIASNSGGTSFGIVLSFTTNAPITPPIVTTLAATNITSSAARLNGDANPNGDATTGYFRYDTISPGTCNDSFGTRVPASGGTALGSGTTPVTYFEDISTLSSSTTYYFCALATNGGGTSVGSVLSFTTDAPPPPEVNFVASVTATGNNPTSGNFTLPGTAQAGDLAVFWWYTFTNTKTITPPGTITLKQNASSAGFGRLYIGYKRLQSGDSTFAWTSSNVSNSTTVWGTSVFTGVISTGDPFEAQSGAPVTFSNTSSPNPPSVTSLTNNAMVVTLFGKNNDYSSITNPSGYLSGGSNTSTTGNDASAALAYFKKVTAGLEDPSAFSAAGAAGDDGYVWTGAIKPGN